MTPSDEIPGDPPGGGQAREILADLVAIAPWGWVSDVWRTLNEVGLLTAPAAEAWGASGPYVAEKRAKELIRDRRLAGHDDRIDWPLLWQQVIAEGQYNALERGVVGVGVHSALKRDREAFLAGDVALDVSLEDVGLEEKLTADELAALAAHRVPANNEGRAPRSTEEWIEAMCADAGLDVLFPALDEAWRRAGVVRGPCPRCERPEWMVTYRPPKAPGRPPLVHTYCPSCVLAVQREANAERMRRTRGQRKVT